MSYCKNINIKDIIISDDFRNSNPNQDKLTKRLKAYETGTLFDQYWIVLNEKDVLIDGYITYLALLQNGYSGSIEVDVRKSMGKSYTSQPTMYVFGKHTQNGKEFVWRVPNRFRGQDVNIAIDNRVIANTKYGKKPAFVTRVEVLDKPPVPCRVKELVTW